MVFVVRRIGVAHDFATAGDNAVLQDARNGSRRSAVGQRVEVPQTLHGDLREDPIRPDGLREDVVDAELVIEMLG